MESCQISGCTASFASKSLLGLHSRLRHKVHVTIATSSNLLDDGTEKGHTLYVNTINTIAQLCCDEYDTLKSNREDVIRRAKIEKAYENLTRIDCPPDKPETTDSYQSDIQRLRQGLERRDQIFEAARILEMNQESRSKFERNIKQEDDKTAKYIKSVAEGVVHWLEKRLGEPTDEPQSQDSRQHDDEMVNRLEVVVKFLATPRKEEDRQFQLDEVAQSLIDLGYKALSPPRRVPPASRRNSQPFSMKGVGFEEGVRGHIRLSVLQLVEERTMLPSDLVVKGTAIQIDRSESGIPIPFASGSLSYVYLGSSDWGRVAIKVLQVARTRPEEPERLKKCFCKEVFSWSLLDHPNVLPLYRIDKELFNKGKVTDPWDLRIPLTTAVISPYMKNRDVIQFVSQRPDKRDDQLIWRLIVEIARGLDYLHSNGIIHGDLRPPNILIDSNRHVKLAQFGMQKYVNNDSIRRGEALSPERVLPEDFGSSQRYQPTKKADVFAVGTVCWQMYEGECPFSENDSAAIDALKRKEFPRPQSLIPSSVQSAIEACWRWKPDDRSLTPILERKEVQEHQEQGKGGGGFIRDIDDPKNKGSTIFSAGFQAVSRMLMVPVAFLSGKKARRNGDIGLSLREPDSS